MRIVGSGISLNTLRVKRRLWGDLLRAALGEVAGGGILTAPPAAQIGSAAGEHISTPPSAGAGR